MSNDPKRDFVNDLTDALVALNNAKPTLPSPAEVAATVKTRLHAHLDALYIEARGASACCGDYARCQQPCYHRGFHAGRYPSSPFVKVDASPQVVRDAILPLPYGTTLASLIEAAKPGEAVIWPQITVPMREVEIRSREIRPLEDHFPDPIPERFVRARALLNVAGLEPREEDDPELAALGERIVNEIEAGFMAAANAFSTFGKPRGDEEK